MSRFDPLNAPHYHRLIFGRGRQKRPFRIQTYLADPICVRVFNRLQAEPGREVPQLDRLVARARHQEVTRRRQELHARHLVLMALQRLVHLVRLLVPKLNRLVRRTRSQNLAIRVIRDIIDTASMPFHSSSDLALLKVPYFDGAVLARTCHIRIYRVHRHMSYP